MNYIQVGKLIKKLRQEKRLTMVDFAKRIDISQPSLSRIESGTQEVSLTLLEKICHEFNISVSEFFLKLEGKNGLHLYEEGSFNTEKLDKELIRMLSSISVEQKQGLYVFLRSFINK